MASSTDHVFFGSWVQIPPSSIIINFFKRSPCRTCRIISPVCAAGVVTKTTDRDSSRYTYNGIRRVRQLTLGCGSNWVKSTHDAYVWKYVEVWWAKALFFPIRRRIKKRTFPGILRKWNRLDLDRSARISGQPGIPPFQGGRVLKGLVWVRYWLTFCKWSNGPIPH